MTNYEMEKRYTWKARYRIPFESNESVMEKFRCLNGSTHAVFNENEVREKIFVNLDEETHWGKLWKDIDIEIWENNKNANEICPVCCQYGYQSCFHQLKTFQYCVFHKNIRKRHKELDYSKCIEKCIVNGDLVQHVLTTTKKLDKQYQCVELLDVIPLGHLKINDSTEKILLSHSFGDTISEENVECLLDIDCQKIETYSKIVLEKMGLSWIEKPYISDEIVMFCDNYYACQEIVGNYFGAVLEYISKEIIKNRDMLADRKQYCTNKADDNEIERIAYYYTMCNLNKNPVRPISRTGTIYRWGATFDKYIENLYGFQDRLSSDIFGKYQIYFDYIILSGVIEEEHKRMMRRMQSNEPMAECFFGKMDVLWVKTKERYQIYLCT